VALVLGDHVQVAQRRAGGELAGVVEQLVVVRERDDRADQALGAPARAVAEVELEVARLDDARAVGHDMDRLRLAALEIGAGGDATVGAEAKADEGLAPVAHQRRRVLGDRGRRRLRLRGAERGQLGLERVEPRRGLGVGADRRPVDRDLWLVRGRGPRFGRSRGRGRLRRGDRGHRRQRERDQDGPRAKHRRPRTHEPCRRCPGWI
jgi:hypothetical protein